MKKIVFVLVVLLFAAPVLAEVVITAAQVGDTNQVTISYEVTAPDVNLPRAFGLDITVSDGNITACIPYMVGECNDFLQGYGIFPGTIQIDAGGNVTNYGNPVSDVLPALDGLDSNGITVELGSLYVGSNWPDASGLLCTITVTEDCNVTIEGNAARCGEGSPALGVVMENPDEVPVVTYVLGVVVLDLGCFDSGHPDHQEWLDVGEPECWCYKYHCHGDADGMKTGDIKLGFFHVTYPDITALVAAWKGNTDGTALGDYVPGTGGICADFGRDETGDIKLGYFRVSYPDITILVANWKKSDAELDALGACGGDIIVPVP